MIKLATYQKITVEYAEQNDLKPIAVSLKSMIKSKLLKSGLAAVKRNGYIYRIRKYDQDADNFIYNMITMVCESYCVKAPRFITKFKYSK